MELKLIDDESTGLDIADLIHEFKLASDNFEDAKRAKEYWQSRLDEALVAREHKSETVAYEKEPGKSLRATRVSNRRISVDTKGMIKQFGVRKLNHVFKDREIDKAKLDAALENDEFDAQEVMPFVKSVDHPYVRLYVVDRKEEAEDDHPEE